MRFLPSRRVRHEKKNWREQKRPTGVSSWRTEKNYNLGGNSRKRHSLADSLHGYILTLWFGPTLLKEKTSMLAGYFSVISYSKKGAPFCRKHFFAVFEFSPNEFKEFVARIALKLVVVLILTHFSSERTRFVHSACSNLLPSQRPSCRYHRIKRISFDITDGVALHNNERHLRWSPHLQGSE